MPRIGCRNRTQLAISAPQSEDFNRTVKIEKILEGKHRVVECAKVTT